MKELECILIEKDVESKLDEQAKKMYASLEDCWREAYEHFINKDEDSLYKTMDHFVKLGSAAYDMDIMKKGYQ